MTAVLEMVARLRRAFLAFLLAFTAVAAHAQITVDLSVSPFSGGVVAVGENVPILVTVSNSSLLSFTNITFNINSSANVQLISGFSGGTCTPPPSVLPVNAQRVAVTVPALGPSASCQFIVDSTALATGDALLDAPAGGQVTAGGVDDFFITGLPALQVQNTNTGDPNSLDVVLRYLQDHCTGSDFVTFNIPGAGPHTIAPSSALPTVTCDGAHIDGYTQPGSAMNSITGPGNNADLRVILQGRGLSLTADNVHVRGLIIRSVSGTPISVFGPGVVIQGNYFNTDPAGTGAFPSGGPTLSGTSDFALIGGPAPGDRNLITGAVNHGGTLSGSNVTWENNQIGGDRNFASSLENTGSGLLLTAGSHTVRGNFIRTNFQGGIRIDSPAQATIDANTIVNNVGPGIRLNGFSSDVTGNSVGGNTTSGIEISGGGNTLTSNQVEMNGGDGILINGNNNTVGDSTIRANSGAGIRVASGNDNVLVSNTATGNTASGIVLGAGAGGAPNDDATPPYDPDGGPNGLANRPVITSVQVIGGSTTFISGFVKTLPDRPVTIELFGNTAPQLVGNGENPLGTTSGTTDLDGLFNFFFNVDGLADNVTATSTVDRCSDGCEETSEYSFPSVVAVPSGGPALTATPSSLTFGPQPVGTFSSPQTSTLTNAGPGTVNISSMTSTGDFQFFTDCGTVLPQGMSCFIDAQFHPLVIGTRMGTITILSDAAASPLNISLTGTGTAGPQPAISLAPDALVFEAVELGERSARQAIRVSNTGTGELTLRGFDTTGDFTILRADFRSDSFAGGKRARKASRIVSDPPYTTCFSYLFPGESCVIVIEFEPTARGPRTGLLIVDSDAPTPSVSARLTGQGGTGPSNQLEVPGVLEFSAQFFGVRSEGQDVRIRNLTDQPVTLIDVVLEGGDFTAGQTCTTIAPRATCAITVFFKPTQLGLRSGSITLRNQTEGATYRVDLRGLGIANPTPLLRLSVSAIGFGTATGPRSSLVRVFNEGQQPIQFNLVSATGDFMAVSRCGTTLAVGQSCDIDVTFFAALTGPRNGSLRVDSNAAGSPHQVELSAVGCRAPSAAFSRTRSLLCGPGN